MSAEKADDLLDDLWYLAAPSREIRKGALQRAILFGEPIVLGRTTAGAAFALRDVCPHRGAPLSKGTLTPDGTLQCPYHGWRFRLEDGRCAEVPALSETQRIDAGRIGVRRFPLHEASGLVWIWRGRGESAPAAPPDIGLPATARPKITVRERAEGRYDEAVIGLVDPAHTPFVHRQWWWREGAPLKEKTKTFEPTALGFKMPAHPPSSNSRIYRFLGGAPATEIEFRLPAVRIETIRAGARHIVSLTAITPTEEGRSDIRHFIYWSDPLLTLLKPFTQRMAENFLAQDGAVLRAQNMNLERFDHRPLFLGDPDEPAKWYLALKRAYAARNPGAPFVNPLQGGVLRWRT